MSPIAYAHGLPLGHPHAVAFALSRYALWLATGLPMTSPASGLAWSLASMLAFATDDALRQLL
jgi:hypothetical protein